MSATLKEIDRLTQTLYATALDYEWSVFRREALALVCRASGASGAAWLTRSRGGAPGEYSEWPELGGNGDLLLKLRGSGNQHEVSIAALGAPWSDGGEQGLLFNYSHRGNNLLTSLVLMRFPRDAEPQKEELRRLVGHMVEASGLSLRQIVQRDEWLMALGRASRGSAALVDADGTIYAASPRFRDLLAGEFGDRECAAVPFRLPKAALEEQGAFTVGVLHLRLSEQGTLYLLHARRPLPLDSLSPREQEIARALAEGKTFKTVARQLDIAVSTVANHASRIYRKLGIYRREELVGLLQTSKIAKAA
ncbi:MAG TPA: LuxR C-terminal-related transcriptional regulator [Solimonas sp.]|nr:LuxR C-terminal-related transcriptional regulator [Solimonas sp.]